MPLYASRARIAMVIGDMPPAVPLLELGWPAGPFLMPLRTSGRLQTAAEFLHMGCEPDLFLGYKGRFVGSGGPARLTLDHFIRAERLTHILLDVVVQPD